jgi:uncharacterized phage-associated protein
MVLKKKKFLEVLHYVINRCNSIDTVGKTVLFKILYFCDFDYYEKYEQFLTGETYSKLERGPAPRHFNECIKLLKDSKKVKEIKQPFKGYIQQKYLSICNPVLNELSAKEIKEIDTVVSKISNMNAKQASAYSHNDMPWKSAKINNNLDYEMVFYRDDMMSVREYDKCQQK